MAHFFNKFFANVTIVGLNLASRIKQSEITIADKTQNTISMFLLPTDTDEIRKIITSWKRDKTPGVYSITAKILKQVKVKADIEIN